MSKSKQCATFANGKPKIGRPTRLTAKVQEEFCKAIKLGLSINMAAAHAGIHAERIGTWLAKGANSARGGYRSFRVAYEKACSEFQSGHANQITKSAADGDWKASAWMLERRARADWGPVERKEISGPDGAPLKIDAEIGYVIRDEKTFRAATDLLALLAGEADSRRAGESATGEDVPIPAPSSGAE